MELMTLAVAGFAGFATAAVFYMLFTPKEQKPPIPAPPEGPTELDTLVTLHPDMLHVDYGPPVTVEQLLDLMPLIAHYKWVRIGDNALRHMPQDSGYYACPFTTLVSELDLADGLYAAGGFRGAARYAGIDLEAAEVIAQAADNVCSPYRKQLLQALNLTGE